MNPAIVKLSLAMLGTTLLIGLTACKQQNSAETLPLPVHTALVQPVGVGNGAKYSASIVPYAQVNLAFQSGGYVDSIRQVKNPSGGMRNIAITRCVHPDVSSLARPAGWDSGPYAEGNRPDEEAFDITSASTVGLHAPGVARAGGCRSETRTVPAEGGGRHEVTITRC